MEVSFLRPFLRNLCCNSPWNYAVFWRSKNQHENILRWEDGFCNIQNLKISAFSKIEDFHLEDSLLSAFSSCMPSGNHCNYPVELAVAEMSSTSHFLGKGLVGEVALTGKARWIYAEQVAADIFNSGLCSEYPDEWLLQFAVGIKTILLFPVAPYGVLQLGSSEMVAEDTTFLSHVDDFSVSFEKSWVPDWRYFIRELSLLFTFLDSSEEPDQTVPPENGIETGDHTTLSMIPMAEETDFGMPGVFVNDLGDMSHLGSGFEQAIYGFSSFDDDISEIGSNFFTFPEEGDLRTSDLVEFPVSNMEMKPLLKAGVANVSSSLDDSSSSKSNITSLNTSEAKHLMVTSKEDTRNLSTSEFVTDSVSCLSPSVSLLERKSSSSSMFPDKQQQRKNNQSSNRERKASRLSKTDDDQRHRPRDRQLIQNRTKELRDLVPNSEKCSIDGLLHKTIKHMLFLKSVTDYADKLKNHEAEEKQARSAKTDDPHRDGVSWAVELGGNDKKKCPIAVKDLNQPGHMLIEMLCNDHDRFLEIADVIHRLQLTVLKGVIDKSSDDDDSSARFIIEASESFHRLDIFWPLMQLLQQKPPPPISTLI